MFGLGMQELIIILVIVLVLFGATRIPQIMRGLGTGVKEFRTAIKDDTQDSEKTEAAPAEKNENPEQ